VYRVFFSYWATVSKQPFYYDDDDDDNDNDNEDDDDDNTYQPW
jgi:hypothetical protein